MSTFLTTILLLIGLLISFALSYYQYLNKKKKNRTQLLLFLLRFFSYTLLILLLINLSFSKKNIELEKPSLFVAIDNSKSIHFLKQEEELLKLIDHLKNSTRLNAKYQIQYFGFGKSVYATDSFNFKDTHTNLSEAIATLSKSSKKGKSTFLVASDGNATLGNSLMQQSFKNPIYTYAVGDSSTYEDLSIQQININRYAYINNRFPIEFFVHYNGHREITKNFGVYHKSKKIYSGTLTFSKDNNAQATLVHLPAEEEGKQFYTVQIESLSQEKNKQNNTKPFTVEVINEKSKILVLYEFVHPDLGSLKRAIESNEQRAVTLKSIKDNSLKLDEFQLVVLYQPTPAFASVFTKIEEQGKNCFLITGTSTDWSFLNQVQKNFSKDFINDEESFFPIYNTDYPSFQFNDIGFNELPPLKDKFGKISFSVPFQTLLYKKIASIETNEPLLATYETSYNKTGVLFGENLWLWRINHYLPATYFETHDLFVAGLIQYLSSSKNKNRLTHSIKSFYYASEPITLDAFYVDENLAFDKRAKIWCTVTNEATKDSKKILLTPSHNRFVAQLTDIPEGNYNFTLQVEGSNEKTSGKFNVLPFEVEQQFITSNYKLLESISQKSQGSSFFSGNSEALIEALVQDNRFYSTQQHIIQKKPIIDWKILLFILITLLGLEWFIRKYLGKI